MKHAAKKSHASFPVSAGGKREVLMAGSKFSSIKFLRRASWSEIGASSMLSFSISCEIAQSHNEGKWDKEETLTHKE